MSKIKENLDNYNKLKKILSDLAGIKLKAGFFDSEKSNSKLTLAKVAKINEFGYEQIPFRPFMRQTLIKNNNFKNEIEDAVKNVISFKLILRSSFRKVGVKIMQEMQREFIDGDFIKNSSYTVKKKKSSRPLIDKGQLRRSVSWRVEK
jgi:hypothetical protein